MFAILQWSQVLTQKYFWTVLLLIGFILEAVALYYQYILGEEPCQVCIHIRIWVAAFMMLSIVMLILPRLKSVNIFAHLVNVGFMVGFCERCWFLLQVERGNANSSCNFYLGFPEWFALDKWLPSFFEVRNLCSFTPEILFGVSMAESLMLISISLLSISVFGLLANFFSFDTVKN